MRKDLFFTELGFDEDYANSWPDVNYDADGLLKDKRIPIEIRNRGLRHVGAYLRSFSDALLVEKLVKHVNINDSQDSSMAP